MKPLSPDEIKLAMINMSESELAAMSFPGLHETLWDEREFLGWRDVQNYLFGYIVFWLDDKARGFMLRAAENQMPAGISAMCVICRTAQPAPQVSLFVAAKAGKAGERGSTVGTYLCADLACPTLIRMASHSRADSAGTRTPKAAQEGSMIARLQNFSERVLTDIA